ncbi:hypothetical protein PM082_024121 [Marasmius tenuissimus]|nr:hypothetical protein PM082_024121 [Marasmius tenuissimus]
MDDSPTWQRSTGRSAEAHWESRPRERMAASSSYSDPQLPLPSQSNLLAHGGPISHQQTFPYSHTPNHQHAGYFQSSSAQAAEHGRSPTERSSTSVTENLGDANETYTKSSELRGALQNFRVYYAQLPNGGYVIYYAEAGS